MIKKEKKSISLICTAGGVGKRFLSKNPKQFKQINGEEIINLSLKKFELFDIKQIVVTAPAQFVEQTKLVIRKNKMNIKMSVVEGGESRAESVKKGFHALEPCDVVLVHDGVRPFVSETLIQRVIDAAQVHGAVIPGCGIVETVKRVKDNQVIETVPREALVRIQTPQAFWFEWLDAAYKQIECTKKVTDEAILMEMLGKPVHVVQGDELNVKVTTPLDIKNRHHPN